MSLHSASSSSMGDNSASASNPSQSTPGSTSSEPRLEPPDKARSMGSVLSKRRRVPESVTWNACLHCKKARAKCDGKKPCTRCAPWADTAPCVYEAHIKDAKEELMRQIHELRAKDKLTDLILKALQSDNQAPDILRALKNGESHESIAESVGCAPTEEQERLPPIDSPPSASGASYHGPQILPGFSWTTVTQDSAVLGHLFQLYFTWVHPVYTLFSEGHFVESYNARKPQHCSSQLVNAMCALACHLHTRPEDNAVDSDRLGILFAQAFRVSFEPSDKSTTSIQAAAVMFLVELGRGFGLRASTYLTLASDHIVEILSTASDELPCVLKNTVQGIRCLNVEWAQVTFRSPPVLGFCAVEDTQDEESSLDELPWYFYRYEDDQCPAWPSLLATTNREKMKLISIINDVTWMMYGSSSKDITARQVLEHYGRFIAWRTALPQILGDVEHNSQTLPHVLSMLILYEYSLVQLLRPLLDFEGFPSKLVEDVVYTHAQHALFLLERHYRSSYTCRFQPVLQMFAILNTCHLIARYIPTKSTNDSALKGGTAAVAIGLETLQESYVGFPAAGVLKELLRRSAVDYSVRVPQSQILAPPKIACSKYSYDDFVDSCTRPNYLQPLRVARDRFDEDFVQDWYSQGPEFGFEPRPGQQSSREPQSESDKGAQVLMQIRNQFDSN